MIETINIKNIATFDPTNGVQITDLKKVNFFFGFNGSGKSTIAKYLHNLSLEESQRSLDFKDCTQNGYNDSNHQILTFDENFTEVNFKHNPSFKGVFSLNEKNDIIDRQIAIQEADIESFKNSKEAQKQQILKIGQDKKQKHNALLDTCWSQRNKFSTFTKINLDHSGSKPNHLQELKSILQNSHVNAPKIEQLTERYNSLYEQEIVEITVTVDLELYKEIIIIERELETLLSEVIVGNEDVDIAALIKKIDSRNWVETGVKYLEQTDDVCPFCQQQTITDNLKNQFNELFDETYKEKIEKIKRLLNVYSQKINALLSSILKIQNIHNPNNLASNTHIKLKDLFDSNCKIIDDKVKNSNEKKSLTSLNTIQSELSKIINSIKQNNTTFSKLGDRKNTLISDIWLFMAQQCQADIETFADKENEYQGVVDLANQSIENYNTKELAAKQTIETFRGQTVNTKDAVDNINLVLKSSGYEGFKVAERDTVNNISRYYLKRNGNTDENPVFRSLSEGEKNFISFLYFFQLCVGTDDIENNSAKKKIIVIDDPVSSLDSQSLFVVSTLIHKLIERESNNTTPAKQRFKNSNITQVFVLTHNLYFYKEVSFEKRSICTKFWHYKITKTNNVSEISGSYNRTVFDDYSLLWQILKDIKFKLPTNSSSNIVISNTMRRVIESFVNFIGLGKNSWGALLTENPEEPSYYIKCSFISTINDESHKVTAWDSIYYQKIINEQPQLLFDVFKEIFVSIGKEHYELMMKETRK